MCGIAGFSLSPAMMGRVNSKRLARELLLGIEPRGHDATGFAYRDSNGDIQVHKAPLTAGAFVKNRLCLPKRAGTAIMHTRFATQGDEKFNVNNHPIRSGPYVGVHNGTVGNDYSIFHAIGTEHRQGEVDSEAIWAAMAFGDEATPTSVLELIEGPAAVGWLHDEDDAHILHVARANTNPLICCVTLDGSFVFASESQAIARACQATGLIPEKMIEVEEGRYLRVQEGVITDQFSFTPARSRYISYRGYSGATHYLRDHDPIAYEQFGDSFRDGLAAGREAASFSNGGMRMLERNAPVEIKLPPKKTNHYFDSELLHLDRATPTMTTEDYYRIHSKREAQIEAYLKEIQDKAKSVEEERDATTALYYELHGLARPGTRVTTLLGDVEHYGEIARVPDEFPTGEYILRLWVKAPDREHGWESVVVARTATEFMESPNTSPESVEASQYSIDAQMDARLTAYQEEFDLS